MKSSFRNRAVGYTLVELLIVLTIIGLMASLVAPLGMRQFDKARGQEEWLSLRRTVDGLAFRAYAQGRGTEIRASGTELSWRVSDGTSGKMKFERLFFEPAQQIVIDANGYADRDAITLRLASAPRTLPLNTWLTR